MLNGSPHPKGCTYTALREVATAIESDGISTEVFDVGTKPVSGCLGCGQCATNGGHCFIDDGVNEVIARMRKVDALVVGSPVHYASPSGAIVSFLDRLFYACPSDRLAHKPYAVVASARRAGTTTTIDVLQKYGSISQMPIVTSSYWTMVHGNTPEEVRQDLEGMQVLRDLGHNMAWLLGCLKVAKEAGVEAPGRELPRQKTNFIR
jgi:multimeric flavodoxin WrbA